MATTIDDVVRKAFRKLNVVGEGGSLSSRQLTEGISDINDIFDSLNTERLIPYYIKREEFTLTSAKKEYTIGVGGDFNTVRPLRILKATITKSNLDYRMRLITYDDWMNIWNKTSSSQIPRWIYYESNYPLASIFLNYTPSEANVLTIASEKQIGEYVAGDAFNLPPAYRLAMVNILAFEMLPRYPSEANAAIIKAQSDMSMDRVRALNTKNLMVEATLDPRVYGKTNNRELFWDGS